MTMKILNTPYIIIFVMLFSTSSFASETQQSLMLTVDNQPLTSKIVDIGNEEYPVKRIRVQNPKIDTKTININSGKPGNPNEIFSCNDFDLLELHNEPVCGHHVEVVYCIKAPCPALERWVTYYTAKKACTADNVTEYALMDCKYDGFG